MNNNMDIYGENHHLKVENMRLKSENEKLKVYKTKLENLLDSRNDTMIKGHVMGYSNNSDRWVFPVVISLLIIWGICSYFLFM